MIYIIRYNIRSRALDARVKNMIWLPNSRILSGAKVTGETENSLSW
jgi:hypothetical protein